MSLDMASLLYDISNWALLAALLLGVAATAGVVFTGNIKESYLKRDLAVMSARAAELENESSQAKLETERLKSELAWRRITKEQHDSLVAALKGKIPEQIWVEGLSTDPEAAQLHSDVYTTLKSAGINVAWYNGIESVTGSWITNGVSGSGKIIKDAFSSIGIELLDRPNDAFGNQKTRIAIIIGTKPPLFFSSGENTEKIDWHNQAIKSREEAQ